jgi:hypothetical protein
MSGLNVDSLVLQYLKTRCPKAAEAFRKATGLKEVELCVAGFTSRSQPCHCRVEAWK